MFINKTFGIILFTTLFTSTLIYFSSFSSVSNAASTTLSFTIVAATGVVNTGNNNTGAINTGNNNTGAINTGNNNNGNNNGSNNGNNGNNGNNSGNTTTGSNITGNVITTGNNIAGDIVTTGNNITTGYIQTGENIQNNNNNSDKNKVKEEFEKTKKEEIKEEEIEKTKEELKEEIEKESNPHPAPNIENQDINTIIDNKETIYNEKEKSKQGNDNKDKSNKVEEKVSCDISEADNHNKNFFYETTKTQIKINKNHNKTEEECVENKGPIRDILIKAKIIKEENTDITCNSGNGNIPSTPQKTNRSIKSNIETNDTTISINVFYSLKDILKPISKIFRSKNESICLSGEYLDYSKGISTKIKQIFIISSPTFKAIIRSIITHLDSFR